VNTNAHTPRSSVNGIELYLLFSFLAEAGPHLLATEGWKAELAYCTKRWPIIK